MLTQLIFFISIIIATFGAKYNCDIYFFSRNNIKCAIYELNVTKNDSIIEPVTTNPSIVTRLELYGKTPILTCGFCAALPNIEDFITAHASVEIIKNYTFHSCEKLKRIEMWMNKFQEIQKNSFKGIKKLTELRLIGGNIPVFDVDLSDLKELRDLELYKLNITIFSPHILREQKKLEVLDLRSNNLFDLDIESILKYTPNLKEVYLTENKIKCTRIRRILAKLAERNCHDFICRQLNYKYNPLLIPGIHCLSDERWNVLYHTK